MHGVDGRVEPGGATEAVAAHVVVELLVVRREGGHEIEHGLGGLVGKGEGVVAERGGRGVRLGGEPLVQVQHRGDADGAVKGVAVGDDGDGEGLGEVVGRVRVAARLVEVAHGGEVAEDAAWGG